MRFPGTQADPAEVKATLLTHHVVAASVLLYGRVALGTLLHTNTITDKHSITNTSHTTIMYYIMITAIVKNKLQLLAHTCSPPINLHYSRYKDTDGRYSTTANRRPTFVLAAIQLDVSLSSSHFLIHFFSHLHLTGSCQFSPHAKLQQNTGVFPHLLHTHVSKLEAVTVYN